MGCDIHAWVEERRDRGDGPPWWASKAKLFVWRDYALFGALAGVRVEDIPHVEPRGLPEKTDFEVQEAAAQWEADGHSHSWLDAREVAAAVEHYRAYGKQRGWLPGSELRQAESIAAFVTELAGDRPDRVRLVFWFDN